VLDRGLRQSLLYLLEPVYPRAVSNPWVVPCPIRVVFIAERAQAERVPRAVL
jgi:hypothetical protein